MKRRVSYRWLRAVLAVSALGWGPVWAEGPLGDLGLQAELSAGATPLEVTSNQEFESGDWVLVQPGEVGTSQPWELVQVEAAGERSLELSRSLVGIPRDVDARIRLVPISLDLEVGATLGVDWPSRGARVPGSALPVEGWAPHGSQVLVFVDGVEAARLEANASGRFAGALARPLSPGSHLMQLVSGTEGDWRLGSESVTFVSLAPPPTPTVLVPANNSFTNDTTPLFSGTAQGGSTVIVAIGGADVGSTTVDGAGNWSVSPTTALSEGAYSASIRAEAGGETSGSVALSFTVDLTPPNIIVNSRPGERSSSNSTRIRFTQSEVARVECSLDDGAFALCTTPYDLADLADGPHVFVIRATDRAGNVDPTPARVTWIVDTVVPTTEILTGPPTWSNRTDAAFTLGASEDVDRYECTLDGTVLDSSDCAPVLILFRLSEGPHVFTARAVDLAGGVGPDVTYRWNTDYTPPSVPVLLSPTTGAFLNSPTPEFSGTGEPGSEVRLLVDGTQMGSATVDDMGNWTLRPSSELTTKTYQVTLEARDLAGNVSSGFSPIPLNVDVNVPDTFLSSPDSFVADESLYSLREANPRFGFRSNEEGVTYECSVDDEPFGPCDALTSGTRSFEPGQHTLRVRARDAAGNVDGTPVTRTWVYSPYQGSGGGLSGCSASGATPLLPLVPLLALLKRRRSRSSRREVAGGSALLTMLMVFPVGSARAQGVDLQQYKPAPGSRDVLGVFSPQVAPGVGLHAGLSVSYARNPLVLRTASNGGFAQSIVSDQVTADVLASISFLNHFELGLALPVTGQWGPAPGELGVFIPENAIGTGLGDLRLVPKAVLPLGETLSLGAAAVVSLPTANSQSFLGSGGVGVQPMLLAQWSDNKQLRVLANVGGRFQPANQVPLLGLNVGNELIYALGAQWSGTDSKLFIQGSLEGAVALNNSQSDASPLELLAAVGYSLPGGVAVRLGGGPGLTSGYGTPNFRLFAGLSWAPDGDGPSPDRLCRGMPDADEDKDGVLNAGDLCPYESGDRGDGCPKDAGAEGVKALAQLFKNDGDNDGVADDVDACPKEPGVKARRGCAVPAQPGGKEPDPIVASLSFPAGKPDTDSPKKLDTVVARVQELLKNNQLAEVHASFPPDQPGTTLMQQRAESVRGALTQRIPELKGSDKLTVGFQGKPGKPSKGKDVLDIKFTFVRAVASKELPPVAEWKCADQGVAARLMSSHGEVTAGAENKLEALANEGKVCDGDLVKTGAAAGAVLVLSDGNVLRLAPDSQVKLSRTGVQLLQGTMDSQGAQAALAAPEIFPPCSGPVSRSAKISWQKVPGARKYWVQVARGADFNSDVRFVLAERTGTSLELPAGGKWFWRVLPVDEKGLSGQPSKIHSFEDNASVSAGPRS